MDTVPGWMDPNFIRAMKECDADVCQHNQWWMDMNNGMSKCWLMQDGHSEVNTRYNITDGAPWSFVYECKESSLPQEALDAIFLFSPHSMVNLRGSMVPTKHLVPRIDTVTDAKKWKIMGVWKKRFVKNAEGDYFDDEALEEDSDEDQNDEEVDQRSRLMDSIRRRNNNGQRRGGGIHDMDLDSEMPSPLNNNNAFQNDLENVSPVRIEAWMTKVFHYDQDSEITGDSTVFRKLFCILTITPVRNLNLSEYLRHSLVENNLGNMYPGMPLAASETMRKDKKDMLHRLLLGQMELCGFFNSKHEQRGGVPDPLDSLNMPSMDYYPANYLSIPMAYRRIQYAMRSKGYDHNRIYVEGFSDTVSMYTISDLRQVKDHNNSWSASFYQAVSEFESLKPEERSAFKANLADSCPPSWPREGEGIQNIHPPVVEDDEDEDVDGQINHQLDNLYIKRNRVPPIKICLWYNPLMYISPSATRSEWEQQLGGFPAFFIYTMSRTIYSSANNPLLQPGYFMPEAKAMTVNARWREYMNDGDNPFASFCVAGWACKQFERVMDACRQAVNVSEIAKIQMIRDYMKTCFNMHLGLIDTKSLRSKTIYFAHKLMQEVNETSHHDLIRFFKDEMKVGSHKKLVMSSPIAKLLADGSYSQVAFLHCETLNILNRDFFHLNDLNLSLLWRMLVTTTHHCVGMHNDAVSAMGSSIIACRGAGHYTGKFQPVQGAAGGGGGNTSSQNSNNGIANTYQALDKPNSVGGDYVVSHHSWMKNLNSTLSSSIRTFDNGQVPSDMTRFTEASMRMIGTVLVDEKNNVRREPVDNLLSQYYQTEMQITNLDQLKSLVMLLPRNMKQGSRGLAVDMSSADTEKTGERSITKRLGVPGYLPHLVVAMTNMRAQLADIKERLETAVIVMQRCFCGGPVDQSVGLYNCLMDYRKQGFGHYNWNAEKALGSFPKETKGIASLYCTAYAASSYYSMLTNKHGMWLMELSTLTKGLCR